MRGFLVASILSLLTMGSPQEHAFVTAERLSQCGRFEVSVFESGFVHTRTQESCGRDVEDNATLSRIGSEQLAVLRALLGEVEFDALPEELFPSTVVSEMAVLVIAVRTDSGVQEVEATGLDRLDDVDAARRFLTIWEAVTALVPKTEK